MVLLVYDFDRGIRYTQTRKRRTKADYAEFMQQIVSTYYADIECVDLVQDNLNTHKYGRFGAPIFLRASAFGSGPWVES